MKTIKFRPLRRIKKSNYIAVASYLCWNKLRCANYVGEFSLQLVSDYENFDRSEFVYNSVGELLFHFNYNPWDVFVYKGSCLDDDFSWENMREQHKSFSILSDDGKISHHFLGADCMGTPTFSHLTADGIVDSGYENMNCFEPLTVGYVMDWLGWFLYQLENSKLIVIK